MSQLESSGLVVSLRSDPALLSSVLDIPAKPSLSLDALVVGASWAGVWTLYRLKQLGLKVKLIEASPEVGGVWCYTHYPGCRVDTEVPLYGFSSENLWRDWNWTERFPSRAEVHAYLCWVFDKLDLRKDVIFNTRVQGVHWQDDQQNWSVYTSEGEYLAQTQFFLPCTGYSTIRYSPPYKGLNTFTHVYHSSQWPKTLDCTGKKVAIIGTAASGVQIVEALAPQVSHLTVFQRTPNLATPMRQEVFTPRRMAELKQTFPSRFAARVSRNGFDLAPPRHNTFDDDEPTRLAFYESLWQRGGLAFWFANYPDMITNQRANDAAYAFWRSKTLPRLHSPTARALLAPELPPHPFGTKRPALETNYFEAFNRNNVTLVDINTDDIVEITPTGLTTASGTHHAVDIIILATGFDYLTGSLLHMGIHGTGGRPLPNKWDMRETSTPNNDSGVWTALGLATAGFPNMFFPMGPQAPSALGLTPQMAEVQGDWIARLVHWMRQKGLRSVQPTEWAERAWKKEVACAAERTLLPRADSWYMGVNIPGKRREALCYFGGVDRYINTLQQCAESGYQGFLFTSCDESRKECARI